MHVTKANEMQHRTCRNLSSDDSLKEEIIGAIKSIYKSFRNSRGGSYLSVTFNTCMSQSLRKRFVAVKIFKEALFSDLLLTTSIFKTMYSKILFGILLGMKDI